MSELFPLLGVREAWVVGLVVVLVVLRPVGRRGWMVASALLVGALATVGGARDVATAVPWLAIALVAWLLLGAILASTVVLRPVRWEPRTGPGAATALIAGSAVVHVGAVWHAGGVLGEVGRLWGTGALDATALTATSSGPLSWPLLWLAQLGPSGPRLGAGLVSLAAVALVVTGAERLGRRWGHVGTARCIAAAVAWAPPLLLAHDVAAATLLATAALVWSWWALSETWAGRHRSGRLAFASGVLLGAAVGVSLWPVVLAPLWLRRFGARTAGWSVVGFGVSLLATVGALVPTSVGLADVWRTWVLGPLETGPVPGALVVTVVIAALGLLTFGRPLSPTRLSAVTAALLLALVPWWPAEVALAGPVAAVPFLLLAAVAPDRPGERWPPDATVLSDAPREVPA